MSYTLTPVRTADFTAANGTNPETLYTWLDPFPHSGGGYYAVITNTLKLEFSQDGNRSLVDRTGTYTDAQYVFATISNLVLNTGGWIGGHLHAQGTPAAPPTTTTSYRLHINVDSTALPPRPTKIQRVTNGTTIADLASTTSVTWATGDKFLFVDSPTSPGVLEVYRDSGSGWGASPILSFDDSAAPITGGGPGVHIAAADSSTIDNIEFGDATAGGGSTFKAAWAPRSSTFIGAR